MSKGDATGRGARCRAAAAAVQRGRGGGSVFLGEQRRASLLLHRLRSLLPSSRDFSRQRHLPARGHILHGRSFSAVRTRLRTGYGVRPEKSRRRARCPAAHGAARPSEEPVAGVGGRRCRGLRLARKEGAPTAKSALLSAHPLPEQLLTSAEIVSLAFSKWLFQGEHQLSARAEAFGSF